LRQEQKFCGTYLLSPQLQRDVLLACAACGLKF